MARTTFSGPVASNNGFEGDLTGNITAIGPLLLASYTLTTLPDATLHEGAVILVSDANSAAGTVAFSDGTDWIDVKTGVAAV